MAVAGDASGDAAGTALTLRDCFVRQVVCSWKGSKETGQGLDTGLLTWPSFRICYLYVTTC
jgi:hypothetical protein